VSESGVSERPARVALITGGSGGIGRAVARRLGEEGHVLALAARDVARLEAAAESLGREGATPVRVFPCDIADPAQTRRLAEDVSAALGRIDVLVNAAGLNRPGLFLRLKPADWDEVIRVNLTGVALTTQAIIGVMRRQRSGAIVTIASLGGRVARPGMASYCASKFGVVGLMDTVRQEVERLGIRVTTILPGEVDTAMHGDGPEKAAQRIRPEDVAEAVVFALRLSDQAVLPQIEIHNRAAE
jgi:short-subunit dehydrogenase